MDERIESARLLLRKVEEDDWLVLYKTVKNSEFPNDLPLKELIQTKTDAQNFTNDAIQKWTELVKYIWTICLKATPNVPIGQISIAQKPQSDKWNVAFWIAHEYQSHGYAKEAVLALTKKLNTGKNKLHFWAGAATWNKASNKVFIKSGFTMIGTQENGYICNGKMIPINEYENV